MLSFFCTDPLPPMLPQNWVRLLVVVQPKNTTKPKIRRKKDLLLLAVSKENTEDLSQSSVSLDNKIEKILSQVEVAQSCPTLCDSMDYIIYGILQARILEWVAFPFSRGSSQPGDRTQLSHIAGSFFTSWGTREFRPIAEISDIWKKKSRKRR